MKYFFGTTRLVGGKYSLEKGHHDQVYENIPASWYWYLLYFKYIPQIQMGWCGSKGAYIRFNDRFFEFFWKPYSSGYYNGEGVWCNSKKFQFLTFNLSEKRKLQGEGEVLNYTWNGLDPEVLRKNWREGDEEWVLIWWKNFNAQSVNKLRSSDPTKENIMNEIMDNVQDQANSIEVKHFALALDKDGKEIRVEINPNTGIAQDADEGEEKPTVH